MKERQTGRRVGQLGVAVLCVLASTAPAHAQNIAGDWSYFNNGSVTCSGGGITLGGSVSEGGTLQIRQEGSQVEWNTAAPGIVRRGTIADNVVRVSGPLALVVGSGITIQSLSVNTYVAQGTLVETATTREIRLSGSGTAAGTACQGAACAPFSCTASDQAVFSQARTVISRAKLAPFVSGFYDAILAREPSERELNDWIDFLVQHPDAGGAAALVAGFFNSSENLHQPMTLAEYVGRLYRTILQRDPSPAEAQAWVDVGVVPAMNLLVPGFVNSVEFQQLLRVTPASDVLARFYRLVLGREPDANGLAGWSAIIARTGDWLSVTKGFLNSPEYVAGERSFAEHVAILYRTFLGREPDAAGQQGWLDILTTHLSPIQSGFTQSPEFQQQIQALFR